MRFAIGSLLMGAFVAPAVATEFDPWPPRITFSDGTELAATGNIAYDFNDFHGDTPLHDDDAVRRREFGATLRKKDVFDAMIYYDFASDTWLDVFARVETKALFGTDAGRIRVGYMKTPVALDAGTSSRAGSFVEIALPAQAFYQGRRTGLEWTMERPQYFLQAGAYGGKDLHGDNPGTTQAIRGVWTPVKAAGDVLHLGLALSVENPRGWHDGRGEHFPAQARLRARPEAGLTGARLVDSGVLVHADRIRRSGLEGVWIHGPFSVQAEALHANVSRENGLPDFSGHGQYIYGGWVVTGQSRPYTATGLGNVKPDAAYGAVELLARYSRLDLDDGAVAGGRQHDWTFGANWYLGKNFKFQANYVKVDASRNGVRTRPDIVELRAQVHF